MLRGLCVYLQPCALTASEMAQMCLQTGLERELVNQHTMLEAAVGLPVQKEATMPWQQLASEPGHILDPLTLSDLTSAS